MSYISGKYCPHEQRGLRATLTLSCFSQSPDRTANSDRSSRVQGVGTSGFDFATILAVPYADSFPLYCELPAELAEILRVLADLHLFNLLPQTSTVSGAIFADDSSFLRTLGLSTQTLRISIMIDTGVEKYILKYKSNSVNNSSYQPITLHRKEIDTVN